MKKQSFLLSLFSAMCLLSLSSCEDEYQVSPQPEKEAKRVNVSLTIGLEQPVDGYASVPQTRGGGTKTGFTAELVSAASTRAVQLIPDKLYNLEIGQYNASGARLAGKTDFGTVELGQELGLGLVEATSCQLLVVVRGAAGYIGSIGTNTLPGIRSGISALWSNITTNIPAESPSQEDINKMPYVLLLENVNVTADGKITNPDGTDVRLLLKRLAARVTVNWDFGISGYDLVEVSLQQVPKLYRLLPTPYETIGGVDTYPSLLDEYVNAYRLIHGAVENPLTDEQTKAGSHVVWVPANVRGVVPEVVNQNYRSKDNAPTGAMFAEFRVERPQDKKRLLCRAYIGGNSTSDFNIRENTDYTWSVSLTKGDITDPRVIGQSLDNVRSVNLVNTANCFMMEPGSDICFNPYKHASGTDGWNYQLVDLSSGTPKAIIPISTVKVLWQMKDAGMTGDLVMGYAIDASQHQNLVDITDADNLEKALVHVITPVTKGGNAVIAAYDNNNNILWSWHLWITDYVPHGMNASTAYVEAQSLSRNGTVHRYNNAIFNEGDYKDKVIMDRNLGATAGGFPGKDATSSEFAKRYGLAYEYGRKDPFFSSVDGTTANRNVIYDGFGNSIGVNSISIGGVQTNETALEYSIRHPLTYLSGGYDESWYSTTQGRLKDVASFWQTSNLTKALYNPCPEGWGVPHSNGWSGISVNNAQWFNSNLIFVNKGGQHTTKGGRLYRLTGANGTPEPSPDINAYSWFPVTGFRSGESIVNIFRGYNYAWNTNSETNYRGYYTKYDHGEFSIQYTYGNHSGTCMLRCVQQ